MQRTKLIFITILAGILISGFRENDVYLCKGCSIDFVSDAPLELIEASSEKLQGALNPAENTFAFSVSTISFQGFNSALQREHFIENYLEADKFPKSSFTGKIIEKVDFSAIGTQQVRAKGKLTIHGIVQDRIIRSTLEVKKDRLIVRSEFTVPLSDHDIKIPRIVYQKIASEIYVTVEAVFPKK